MSETFDTDAKHNPDPETGFTKRNEFEPTKQVLRVPKPVVILGRCFGTISRGDVLDKEKSNKKLNFSMVVSTFLTLFLLINAILMIRLNIQQFQKDKTTLVSTEGFCHFGYAFTMFMMYGYQLFATSKFRDIVQSLIRSNELSNLNRHEGSVAKWFSGFHFSCCMIIVISMFLGVAENVLYDIQQLARVTGLPRNTSIIQKYYTQNFNHWHVVIPSSITPVTVIFVITIKLCTWGWVYLDTISMILCRALYEKLRIMDKSLAADLSFTSGPVQKKNESHEKLFCTTGKNELRCQHWKSMSRNLDIYQDEYLIITSLVNQVQGYIPTLILGNYISNLYAVVVMLFYWLGPFAKNVVTLEQSVYVCFAFFQYCYRIVTVTYFAAEVHQISISMQKRLQACPNDQYTVSVERLERTLVSNPAGIYLFGTFMITRHYFASIIGFIFTAEIILLQTYAGYVPAQG